MTAGARSCRGCRSDDVVLVLDLGDQPASDSFPLVDDPRPDAVWPLELWVCRGCGLAQLGGGLAPFPEAPRAVESATMTAHAGASAARVVADLGLGPGSTVAEFDSHHGGSWSPYLGAAGLRAAAPRERADLVLDVHALPHEDDLGGALSARAERMDDDGFLVLEFHHVLPLVLQGQFDTVRHGHPLYLSLHALARALSEHGLSPVSARTERVFGGSLVVTAAWGRPADPSVAEVLRAERAAGVEGPGGFQHLQERARTSSLSLRLYLEQCRDQGRRVLGYGAPSKACVLLCCSGVGPDLLPFTADLSPAKHGRRIPGSGVPIFGPQDLLAQRPDDVVVLTWDIAEEIAAQLPEVAEWGGRFVVPVPEPRVITGRGAAPCAGAPA